MSEFTYTYEPSQEAKDRPRHGSFKLSSGVAKIGIGKRVVVDDPPHSISEYPEATEEQYKELYYLGFTHLVDKVKQEEKPKKDKDVQRKKSAAKTDS